MPATGPSFRDATRVAGANPGIWTGIYRANRDALLAELDGASGLLAEARALLEADDAAGLEAWQAQAAERRRALLEAAAAGGPLRELGVSVPNRPGVIADLALALSREGIGISDLSLTPSGDGTQGHVSLWVPEDRAERAAQVITERGFPVA